MSNVHFEDVLSQSSNGVPMNVYLAVKQVEDAIRLFAHDQLKNLQQRNAVRELADLWDVKQFKTIWHLNDKTDNLNPHLIYIIIHEHLRRCEIKVIGVLKSTQLISDGLGMLYAIYQAYKELNTIDLPAEVKVINIESDFQQYLETVNKKLIQ
ncbi:hypothetical protein [Lysinibacillus capsici]|uniref:hypothetical protein n=1 Tax=Lysinibacillus capsici TaxID=2115968 RepID=UPI003D73DEAF